MSSAHLTSSTAYGASSVAWWLWGDQPVADLPDSAIVVSEPEHPVPLGPGQNHAPACPFRRSILIPARDSLRQDDILPLLLVKLRIDSQSRIGHGQCPLPSLRGFLATVEDDPVFVSLPAQVCIHPGVRVTTSIFFRVSAPQSVIAKFFVNVVKLTFCPSGVTFSANHLAGAWPTRSCPFRPLPKPASGPLRFPIASFFCMGCKNTRHWASGAFRISVKASSLSTTTNRDCVSAFSSDDAKSPVSMLRSTRVSRERNI